MSLRSLPRKAPYKSTARQSRTQQIPGDRIAGGIRYVWRKRHIRRKISTAFKIVVSAALISYLVLTGIHLSNGFGILESLEMGVRDARLAITCPTKPKVLWGFIDRTRADSVAVGLGLALDSGHLYNDLCSFDDFPPVV